MPGQSSSLKELPHVHHVVLEALDFSRGRVHSEDDIWKEFLNYQPQGDAKIDSMHKDDWKVLADLSDMVAKGEYLALTQA